MTFIKKNISFLIFLIFVCSCKKVLDVNLKESAPQIVITGEVNNLPGPYRISISRSVNFGETNDFPPISGALVTIKNKRITDTLSEDEPGKYFTKRIKGKPGESYTLKVDLQGKIYTATSVMPLPVELDSISFLSGRKNTIYPVANFQDPPGVHNYYQFIEYIDGATLRNGRGNSVFDDRLSDGRYITSVIYNDSSVIKTGATLTVQMNCIDEKVYTYLSELLQITNGSGGGFGSPAPANPESNISGGVLGYFSANFVSSRTVTIE
ncbi:DUF4249 domain-containing protein [Hanamia caeni]|jgi:hypothetical protein|uniref:DUF4249 domain-containing protein n=1 Tax=Hanamia caeni TaxID=2294116 RepID=A0A3M9NJL4_9BACT|nr:DUF4249 domain-containing protein [Hanamia caeni]RNI37980.1 DUF4249 domain-containing protein [Hanamia caeni]